MLTIGTKTAWLLAAAVVFPAAAAAAAPALADIAACNDEAAARTSGAASPGTRPPRDAGARTKEGTKGEGARGERTDPTGSIVTDTDDPALEGMDAQRASDPTYRAAYRACMQARTTRPR